VSLIEDAMMTYRKQRKQQRSSQSLWGYLFFNPRAADSFDTWRLIFETRRLCNQIDRSMRRCMTPEQYRAYRNDVKPERKVSWFGRLFGGGR
jgi:hypothetical protein